VQRVTGLTDEQVRQYELRIESVIRVQLQMVMDRIADRIAAIQTASALVLVAADVDDGLPPGQPYVSPDDLASISPLWQEAVAQTILPIAAEVFQAAGGAVYAQMVDAIGHALPSVGSLAAEQYLAQARNTFDDIGNDLWQTARNELLDGFEQGESIPQLAERLRSSAGMTAKQATLVGRTKVIEASNAGSMATARASMLDMVKEWIATMDPRTRPTHLAADGQRVPLAEKFTVGGFQADFPADPDLPPSMAFNCRCTVGYLIPDDQPDLVPIDGAPGTTTIDRAIAEQGIAPPDGTTTVERALEVQEALPRLPGTDVDLGGELVEASTIVRPVLARAKTERELQAAWRAEFQRIAGRDVLIQMPPNASLKTMSQYAEGTLQALERFPEAKIGEISWWSAPGKAYAQVTPGGRHGSTLQFNAWWASNDNRAKLLRAMRGDTKGWDEGRSAWSVRNATNPTSTAYHEFAHVLDLENLGGRVGPQALAVVRRNAIREGVDEDALVSRDISIYAGSDVNEMIAEAFTDVMINGPRASLVSREIYDLMAVEYRRGGFNLRLGPVDADVDVFPRLPASRLNSMTVAQLRALAGERGVTIPPGARKADLVRLLDEGDAAVPDIRAVAIERVNTLIKDIPAGTPGQFRNKVRDEMLRQAEIAPTAVRDLLGMKIATRAEWRELHHEGMDPQAIYVFNRGRMYFSPTWAEDNAAARATARSAFENDRVAWSFPDFNMRNLDVTAGILRHEFGHHVAGNFRSDGWTDARRRRVLVPLAEELNVAAPTTTDISAWFASSDVQRAVRRLISPRAADSPDEMFAELWAVYSGRGAEASAIARRMGVIIRDTWETPAVVAKPVASATSKLTVTALRKLAKERGIDVPAGIRKPDLVKLIDESPSARARVLDVGNVRQGEAALRSTQSVQDALHRAELLPRAQGGIRPREMFALQDTVYDPDFGYAKNGYRDINRGLQLARGGDLPADIRQRVEDLDRVIGFGSVRDEVVLYRGIARPELLTGGRELRLGDEFTEYGYSSTTVSLKHADEFAKGRSTPLDERTGKPEHPTVVRFIAPKGQHAIQVSDLDFPGVGEVLLPRGMSYRVVADRGVIDGVHHYDVEIVPSAAPQLTPAQIQRAAARARNAQIESSAGTARLLAEVDEIIAKGANRTALRQTLDDALIAPEQLFAGADPAVLDALKTALATGDMAKLKAAVTRLSTKAKIKVVGGKAGAKVKFDADTMEGVGGIDIPAGAQVTVVRRGSTVTMPDGEVVTLEKARVTPVASATPDVPTIPGLTRQTGKPASPSVNAKATNPNYGSTQNGETYRAAGKAGERYTPDMGPLPWGAYEENCSNVVYAFEMRMRGYDVEAAPLDVLDKYGYAAGRTYDEMDQLLAVAWRLPGGRPHGRSLNGQTWRSFAEIDTEIEQWPEGGRGMIFVGKHIFNVVKVRGKAQYTEAQFDANATRNVTALYKKKYKSAGLFSGGLQEAKLVRLDDLEPTDRILEAVQPR